MEGCIWLFKWILVIFICANFLYIFGYFAILVGVGLWFLGKYLIIAVRYLILVLGRYINHHEYVDLGLSVKWATCNVGARSPEGYGKYYAWGEIYTKSSYDYKKSETYGVRIDNITRTRRDVAHVRWGGAWRMSTWDEFQELIDNCDCEWTTQNGVNGEKFTSRKNGNSIFLPAAGSWLGSNPIFSDEGSSFGHAGEIGVYWSSTSYAGNRDAFNLRFDCDSLRCLGLGRQHGHSVRPVSE